MATTDGVSDSVSIGEIVDRLYEIQQARYALQRQVEDHKRREVALKARLEEAMNSMGAHGVSGTLARVSLIEKEVPFVSDSAAFQFFMSSQDRFDLAYALRPSPAAIREMWENGVEVPGIDHGSVTTISINKL